MAKIKWKNHIREFIVVVFGILLAFQLDRCASENNQQKLVKEHLQYLEEETQLNLNVIKGSIRPAENNLKLVDSVSALVIKKEEKEAINSLTFQIMNVGYLYVRRNAYKSFINSGDIRFLDDFSKKKKIVNLYEYYAWTQSIDEMHRVAFNNDLFPYIKNNFDLVTGQTQEDTIYFSKKFSNALGTYRFALDLKLNKYRDCKKVMETFLEDIK